MTVVDSAVGYLFTWLVRRARRTEGRAGLEALQELDSGLERLYEVIATGAGMDSALARAVEEAGSGRVEPTEPTLRHLTDALAAAVAQDPRFAEALCAAVAGVEAAVAVDHDGGPDIQDTVGPTRAVSDRVGVAPVKEKPRRRPSGAARSRPASPRHLVGTIPSRARFFQYRRVATRLRAAMSDESRARAAALCVVLTGVSGVGKTQLAADHAHRAWQKKTVDLLVWVTSATRTAVIAAYAQAGAEVCGADVRDPEQAAGIFLAWLRGRGRRWLVVLDDVADPDDLEGLWPPEMPSGRTLVTARQWDAPLTGRRLQVEVQVFTPADARTFLTRRVTAQGRVEPDDQLAGLAADLGRLPSALSQAAAFLLRREMGVADYRALLREHTPPLGPKLWNELLGGWFPTFPAVFTAWFLSVEYAEGQDPAGLALPVLGLVSMLDANGIPASVLTSPAATAFLTGELPGPARRWWQRWARRAVVTAPQVTEALSVLSSLGLIGHSPGVSHQAVSTHALAQRMTRGALSPAQYSRYARAAADAVGAAWTGPAQHPPVLHEALRANTAALAARANHSLIQPDSYFVVYQGAESRWISGRPGAAGTVTTLKALLPDRLRLPAPRHPEISLTRAELLSWRDSLRIQARRAPGSGSSASRASVAPVDQRNAGREDHGDADHRDPPGLQH